MKIMNQQKEIDRRQEEIDELRKQLTYMEDVNIRRINSGRLVFMEWWKINEVICEGEDWTPRMIAGDAFHAGYVKGFNERISEVSKRMTNDLP